VKLYSPRPSRPVLVQWPPWTRTLTRALTLILTLILLGPVTGPAAGQRGSFSGSADVVVVEIPVTVTRDGAPVRGLTAANFEVLDGRKKQEIIGFEVVDLGVPTAAERAGHREPLPTAGRRHFLFLFDLSFSDPTAIVRAREAAREVLFDGLHPEDLAAVATYSTLKGPNLVLGFTPDRAQLAMAMETLGVPDLARGRRDPLGLVFAELQPSFVGDEVRAQDQRETDQAVEEYVQEVSGFVPTADQKEQAGRVSTMTRQMTALARILDNVQGRKYVVFLSEGFDDKLLVGSGGDNRLDLDRNRMGNADPTSPGTGLPTTSTSDAIASGESYNVNTDEMFGSGQVQNALQGMLQEFRKADCTIQAVDIGGLRAANSGAPAVSGQNVLSQMASETGGEVFRNFNDLGEAMGRMLERTSVTYLLAIQPSKLARDGQFHRLRVRLEGVPRGAEVLHRPGYYAPLPLKEQQGLQRQLATASTLMDTAGGALPTAVLATAVRADSGKAYVPVMIEVEGQTLAAGASGDVLVAEIYAYALDADGSVHDFFTHTLPIDLAQAGGQLRGSGLKYFGHLDLDPGQYTVRVLVRNVETGISSVSVLPLAVPDFATGAPALSPPLFPESMGKWVMVTEAAERRRSVAYPFMLGEQPFIPAARPELAKKGELAVPVLAYNLGEGELSVVCRLLGADGQLAAEPTVRKVERMAGASPGASTLVVHLESKGLKPGTYTLEVEVHGATGGKVLTTATSVTVEGRG